MIGRILSVFNKPVSSVGMGLFRILFGLIMCWEVLYFYRIGLIKNFFLRPKMTFNYDFFPVTPIGETGMEILLAGLLISTILITLGVFFRWAMTYFFIVFSYFFLIDKGIYNNHLYLISLISFLLIFTNADNSFSLQKSKQGSKIPYWQYFILQFQLVVVYFYGGLAKINPYWLKLHPIKEFLSPKAKASGMDFLDNPLFQKFICYSGIGVDLTIGFLLWHPKTRKLGLLFGIIFNLTNSRLFDDINIFPFFMTGALILFVAPDYLAGVFNKTKLKKESSEGKNTLNLSKIGLAFAAVFMIIQIALPLRHYTIPGYVDWTGEGQRFAWRMKIQTRSIDELKFAVFDKDKKEIHEIDPKNLLSRDQFIQMSYYPKMIIQFAEFLEKHVKDVNKIPNSIIKAKVKVKFNGTESSYIFSPELDLIENYHKNNSFNDWINPLPKLK